MKKTKILLVGALLFGVPSVALSLSTQQENATMVRAAENVITINYDDDFTPSVPIDNSTNVVEISNGTIDLKISSVYKKSTYSYLMMYKGNGIIYNTNSLGCINKIGITYSGSVSKKAKIAVDFGAEELSSKKDSLNYSTISGQGKTDYFTNSIIENGFFQISNDSTANLQITKIDIYYSNPNAKKYNITYHTNGGECEKEKDTYIEGNKGLTLPTAVKNGYKFIGWFDENNNEAVSPFAPTNDIDLYAKWEELNTVVDKITAENLSATNTTYKEFTYKSSLTNIEYKGITANNNGIQINGKNNYGIVVTKSNYIIKNITIEWNSSTTADKELSIYTSTEAYTNSSDLYDYAVPVTSLSKNDATTYSFETNYNYVGIRSKSGVIVLNSISFEWELDKTKPTIDSTILATDYLCTNLMHDNNGNISITKAIRFIGSVNETKFADLQKVGFNFTLNNTTTKEYNTELSKLYHIIDDSDNAFDVKSDEIYAKNGYLNYSLILNNIPDNFAGTITYYAFATINDVNYQTEAITIKLVNGTESK